MGHFPSLRPISSSPCGPAAKWRRHLGATGQPLLSRPLSISHWLAGPVVSDARSIPYARVALVGGPLMSAISSTAQQNHTSRLLRGAERGTNRILPLTKGMVIKRNSRIVPQPRILTLCSRRHWVSQRREISTPRESVCVCRRQRHSSLRTFVDRRLTLVPRRTPLIVYHFFLGAIINRAIARRHSCSTTRPRAS